MRYIWIDLWNKKVGIALETQGISIPKDIVPRTKIIQYLKKIIKDQDITHIIVGLPYDLYGIEKTQLIKTKDFIEKLSQIFPDLEIIGYDERFTTQEARRDAWKIENVDDISASLILESYLFENKIYS